MSGETRFRCYYCGTQLMAHETFPEFRKVDGKDRKLPLCVTHWQRTGADKTEEPRDKLMLLAVLMLGVAVLRYLMEPDLLLFGLTGGAAVLIFLLTGLRSGAEKRAAQKHAYYIRPEHRHQPDGSG